MMKLEFVRPLPSTMAQADDTARTAPEPGLDSVHEESVGKNPVPLTAMCAPGRPVPGLRVIIDPPSTLKIIVPESPWFPLTTITYCPGRTLPTMKLPAATPLTMVHAPPVIIVPVVLDSVQRVSV